jgi:Tol biopolymer transport system component
VAAVGGYGSGRIAGRRVGAWGAAALPAAALAGLVLSACAATGHGAPGGAPLPPSAGLSSSAFGPGPSAQGAASRTSATPAANAAAFLGQGALAFVWGEGLYVLDGSSGTVRAVAGPEVGGGGAPVYPRWSPDGQWIAFLRADPKGLDRYLWLVRADGSGARQALAAPVLTFAWSPTADVLAVAPTQGGGLWLVPASGGGEPQLLAAGGTQVWSLAWAPDGRALAYVVTLPGGAQGGAAVRSDVLYTVAATGGTPTQRLVAQGDGLYLAGWWPDGAGVLYWRDPQHSASLQADGLPLYTLRFGGAPRELGTTLVGPEWLAFSPDGSRVALVVGAGRDAWSNKSLQVCAVESGTCRAWPQPAGTVSLDPAWSGDGRRLAFVRAAVPAVAPTTAADLDTWNGTRRLWLAAADGSGPQAVAAAGSDVFSPRWSRDGLHLLYVANDAVQWLDVVSGQVTRLVGPFPVASLPSGYHGQVQWGIDLDWHQG